MAGACRKPRPRPSSRRHSSTPANVLPSGDQASEPFGWSEAGSSRVRSVSLLPCMGMSFTRDFGPQATARVLSSGDQASPGNCTSAIFRTTFCVPRSRRRTVLFPSRPGSQRLAVVRPGGVITADARYPDGLFRRAEDQTFVVGVAETRPVARPVTAAPQLLTPFVQALVEIDAVESAGRMVPIEAGIPDNQPRLVGREAGGLGPAALPGNDSGITENALFQPVALPERDRAVKVAHGHLPHVGRTGHGTGSPRAARQIGKISGRDIPGEQRMNRGISIFRPSGDQNGSAIDQRQPKPPKNSPVWLSRRRTMEMSNRQ